MKTVVHLILVIGVILLILNWFLYFGDISDDDKVMVMMGMSVGILILVSIWVIYFNKLRKALKRQGINDSDVWMFAIKSVTDRKNIDNHRRKYVTKDMVE